MAPIAMLASFGVEQRVKMHYALLFLLEAAMLGYFLALNFFFFFIFWEFSLVPAYFIISHWGRNPEQKRQAAAFKFFVYTMAGSVGMLLLFQFFYVATASANIPTFDLITLGRLGQGLEPSQPNLQTIIFNYVDKVRHHQLPWALPAAVHLGGVLGDLRRLRDQAGGLAVPHLAAGCLFRSADGRLDPALGGDVEDGRVWHAADHAADRAATRRSSSGR